MTSTIFRNESEVSIAGALRERLTSAAIRVTDSLRESGATQESLKDSVVVIGLPPQVEAYYSVVLKTKLRDFLASLDKEFAKSNFRPARPRESLIARCIGPSPDGSVRALFITDTTCGSMQIHMDASDSTKWEHGVGDGRRVMSAVAPSDKESVLRAKLAATVADAESYMDEKQLKLAQGIHERIKHLPVKEALQVVEDAELATSEEMQEIRERRAALGEATEDVVSNFIERLPDFRERWKSVQARVKKVVIPPDTATANNLEVTVMSAAYVFDPVTVNTGLSKEEVAFLIGHFSANDAQLTKLLQRMSSALRGRAFSGELQSFGIDWMRSGFPKLEVGHKLAASLALTDVPDDIEVVAPWKAWSLIVPPNMFGVVSPTEGDFARLWCVGTEILFVVLSKGGIAGPMTEQILAKMFAPESDEMTATIDHTRRVYQALSSLVKGACLALANPDDYKKQSLSERHSKPAKKQRDGEPDFEVSRFMLSAPVQIDVRQHLQDLVSGRKKTGGGAPTVQFFVRGHWRNQAHGPRMSLRKQMRIEGYWKGPEHGAIKLGNYKVKDEAQETTSKNTEAKPTESG